MNKTSACLSGSLYFHKTTYFIAVTTASILDFNKEPLWKKYCHSFVVLLNNKSTLRRGLPLSTNYWQTFKEQLSLADVTQCQRSI